MLSGLSKLVVALFATSVASALHIPNQCASTFDKRIVIGYRGIREAPHPPVAAHGGQLGAVLYSVDLAKHFAGNVLPSAYVCIVSASADAWAAVQKAWVPAAVLAGGGGAVDAFLPHGVVFAPHLRPVTFPPQAPLLVFQLGIRQAEIATLGIQTDCRPKTEFLNEHNTLNYPSLNGAWNIHPFMFGEVEVEAEGWNDEMEFVGAWSEE